MSIVTEQAACLQRRAYFENHFLDYPFPLNGTDWAREIREQQFRKRHPNRRCEGPANFLNKVQNNVFQHMQRSTMNDAMKYWFHRYA